MTGTMTIELTANSSSLAPFINSSHALIEISYVFGWRYGSSSGWSPCMGITLVDLEKMEMVSRGQVLFRRRQKGFSYRITILPPVESSGYLYIRGLWLRGGQKRVE